MSVKINYVDVPGVRTTVVEAMWTSRADPFTLKSLADGTPVNYGAPDGTAMTFAIIDAIRDKVYRGPKADLKDAVHDFQFSCDAKHTWLSLTLASSVSVVSGVCKIIAECVCPASRLAKADQFVRQLGVKADREATAAEAEYIHSALKSGGFHILIIGRVSQLKSQHREKLEADVARKFKDNLESIPGRKEARKVDSIARPEFPYQVKVKGVGSYLTKKLLEDKAHVRCFIVGDELYSLHKTDPDRISDDGVKSFARAIHARLKDDAAASIAFHCASKAYFPPSDIKEFASQRLTEATIASLARRGG